MGKIPPSFRPVIGHSLIRKPPVAAESHNSTPPHYFPNKFPPKKDRKVPERPQETKQHPAIQNLLDSPDLPSAKKVFNSIISSARAPPDIRFHNALLQSYAEVSSIRNSMSLLQHMVKKNPTFSPNWSTYHTLLSQSCKKPESSLISVHETLNFMVTNGFKPNQVTTDIAIRSLVEAGRVDDAVELVKELSLKHSPPDNFTFNFIVKSLCKCRTLSTVYGFIEEMKKSFGLQPDLVTYTILIDNVCNSKNLREAMRLLGVLHECGFKPDCFVYNTIMKGYCMLSRGSEAIEVFEEMRIQNVMPDLVTYNTLIFGLSKSGRVKEARKYLDVMLKEGFLPDTVTYTSLMNGMCREGHALGALALLEEMERKGCSPNECTYNTLLHGLCKGRFLDKGMELFKVVKSAGMKLDTATYGTIVRTLCRAGKVAEAYDVFDYAVETKSLTDVAAYTTLESTLKWLKKAREQGHAL